MEHSRLLKFLVPGRDKTNTIMSEESTSPTFKIQYDYQNPTDVEAEVPSSQNIREIDPATFKTSNEEITDGAVIEFRNGGGYTVTKRTYMEHREIVQGTEVTQTKLNLSTGDNDVKEIELDDTVDKRPKTKIPKLKFRQAAERVRAERRKSNENKEHTSHIPTPRTSIPKLSRVSKIPPPTTKPIVLNREIKQTIVTSRPDDDFDKIYEEIVENTDGAGDLTDPEKVDSEFEEIIHAYDEKKVQIPTPKVRPSKIPSLRRKSDHEVEVPKSSARFTEKSKVRSIPRLKEISMRAKEDNNDISQVVRQYTKTVRTKNISGKNDLESKKDTGDIEKKSSIKTSKLTNIFKTGEVGLIDQNLDCVGELTENASMTRTTKSTKIIITEKSYENDTLLFKEQKVIDDTKFTDDTDNKTIAKISKSTKTVNTNAANENDKKLVGEDRKSIDDKESINVIKTTEITSSIKTQKLSNKNNLDDKEEEEDVDISENNNIGKMKEITKVIRTDKISQDSNISDIIKESQINTSNRSMSIESKHDTPLLKTENITKTSIKVGIPIFNKQVSESYMGKNTQTSYTNKNIERSSSEQVDYDWEKETSDRDRLDIRLYDTDSESKVTEANSDTLPTRKESYSITHVSSNLNNTIDDQSEIEYRKDINKELSVTDRKSYEVKSRAPSEITKTVTITRLISSPNEVSKNIEHRNQIENIKTIKVEKDIEISQPSILKFETVPSKESTTTTTVFENNNTITTTTKIDKESTEDETSELKGKVGRLINKMDTKTLTLADIPRKDEELPKKKSILSKIAMFERQDINEPMPKRKPRPEKLYIKEAPREQSVHIHTPKIVEEVLKPVQTSEIKDQEGNIVSPYDPFLTYKPLYEYYKTIEINKSIESLDTTGETTKSLELKTPNPLPLSPLRTTYDSNSFNNKSNSTSSIMVDAPVIVVSPKINFKKNINLNTDENTAEFAKTVVSVKETKNIEVLKPVQINLDCEVSKIEVESLKIVNTSSDTEVTAFKDVKKNIAMYENYGNLSKTLNKDKSTNFKDHIVDTKSDKDRANFEIKVKNELKYDSTKSINETFVSKEDIKFEHVQPFNNILTKHDITYENINPINEIVAVQEEFIKPINQVMIAKEELKYEKTEPTNIVLTKKEEVKYEKVRPVSEVLTTKIEIKHENVRPISQILTVKDENIYEKVRPISEILTVSEDFASGDSNHKNGEIQHGNWFVNKSTLSGHNNDVDQTEDRGISKETFRLDWKYKENQSKDVEDDIRRVKSVAELDLGDAVKGKVNNVILRMKSVERFDFDKKEVINFKEMPRMMSVSEKIALFERKVTPARSDSVFISSRSKSTRARLTIQLTEEDYQQKLAELQSVKKKYGKREKMPSITLSNGAKMPVLALGTALLDARLTPHAVSSAIELGYRAIDCAYINGNEKEIGDAIREKIADGTVKREDLFVTSKLWSTLHRRDLVEKACRASLDAMGLSYFDLYLIQNPMSFKEGDDPIPKIATVLQYSQHDYLEAWYGMEDLVSKGLVKNIGVSNFNSVQIQRILDKGKIKPVVNQVECHPYLSQQRLHSFCAERNIILSCFGVLGSKGTPVVLKTGQVPVIDDPLVQVMASGLNMTPAQLLIRYQIECGHNVVVNSSSGFRLWGNLQSLDFALTPGQIDALHALNRNKRNHTFSGMGDTHKNYPFKIAF